MIDSKKLNRLSTQLISNPDNPIESFRKNLQMYLEQKELTLSELSDLANISQSTLRSFVYGNCKDCHISNVIKLARVFNVSIDELIGCETFGKDTLDIIKTKRQLPNSFECFIHWIADYYYKVLYENRVTEKSVPVMNPIVGEHNNLQMTNKFDIVDISSINPNMIPKIFMGIRIPCDAYVPIYFPGDIMLIANDRNPKKNEDFIICTGKNLWISNKIGDNYYSARDKTFRLTKNEVTADIGYVVEILENKN